MLTFVFLPGLLVSILPPTFGDGHNNSCLATNQVGSSEAVWHILPVRLSMQGWLGLVLAGLAVTTLDRAVQGNGPCLYRQLFFCSGIQLKLKHPKV